MSRDRNILQEKRLSTEERRRTKNAEERSRVYGIRLAPNLGGKNKGENEGAVFPFKEQVSNSDSPPNAHITRDPVSRPVAPSLNRVCHPCSSMYIDICANFIISQAIARPSSSLSESCSPSPL